MVPKILQINEFERKEVYNILSTFFYLTKRKLSSIWKAQTYVCTCIHYLSNDQNYIIEKKNTLINLV